MAWRRSRPAFWNIWRCASWRPKARPPSSALSGRPASARPRSASRSPGRWAAPVRPHQPWAGCIDARCRNPRPSAHLCRRAARQHHPGDPQVRRARLRHDAGRDRQDGQRHPGRSVRGHAGSARSRAELDLPRQLSGRAVRPVARRLHRHRQFAGDHPRAVARSDGDHRPLGLHGRREAGDRQTLSAAPATGGHAARAVRPGRCR